MLSSFILDQIIPVNTLKINGRVKALPKNTHRQMAHVQRVHPLTVISHLEGSILMKTFAKLAKEGKIGRLCQRGAWIRRTGDSTDFPPTLRELGHVPATATQPTRLTLLGCELLAQHGFLRVRKCYYYHFLLSGSLCCWSHHQCLFSP